MCCVPESASDHEDARVVVGDRISRGEQKWGRPKGAMSALFIALPKPSWVEVSYRPTSRTSNGCGCLFTRLVLRAGKRWSMVKGGNATK